MVRLVSPRRTHHLEAEEQDGQRYGGIERKAGTWAFPKVAVAKVRLWATVKALTVFKRVPRSLTISRSPSTNSIWSTPIEICRMS